MDTDTFLKFLFPLSGTFAGAFIAYWTQNRHEQKKEDENQLIALNKALFILLRQINALAAIKEQHLDKVRNDEFRSFTLHPFHTNMYNDLKFNCDSLIFLLDQKYQNLKGTDILQDLLIEQERFEQTLRAIELRTDYQVKIIQPHLEEFGIEDTNMTLEKGKNSLREYKSKKIVHYTDQVYENVDETLKSSGDVFKKLHYYSKKRFPKKQFPYIEVNRNP